nr:TIGR02234 family membrane protein [Modestobacter versicolor]
MTVALLLCALAGALALSSSSQPWADVTVTRRAPLPPTSDVLTGGQAAPLVGACGLLLLAAAVAVIAVRGVGRVLVGLLVAVAGGVLAWSGLRGVTGGLDLDVADVTDAVGLGRAEVTTDPVAGWPVLALVAGVLAVLAGLLVVLRGRRWPGMGRRYERTGTAAAPAEGARPARPARPETDEDRHQAAWKALDRGDDPTE